MKKKSAGPCYGTNMLRLNPPRHQKSGASLAAHAFTDGMTLKFNPIDPVNIVPMDVKGDQDTLDIDTS